MKVQVLQENLQRGLSIVGRAVATRSTLPITANVLLSTDNGRLKLAATDLEIGLSAWVGAKIDEEGATTIPSRLISDFVSSLPSAVVLLQIPENESVATTQDRIFRSAYDFNTTKKGRLLPAKTVGEALEHVPAKFFKEAEVWVKTKNPVLMLRTDNEIPKE